MPSSSRPTHVAVSNSRSHAPATVLTRPFESSRRIVFEPASAMKNASSSASYVIDAGVSKVASTPFPSFERGPRNRGLGQHGRVPVESTCGVGSADELTGATTHARKSAAHSRAANRFIPSQSAPLLAGVTDRRSRTEANARATASYVAGLSFSPYLHVSSLG